MVATYNGWDEMPESEREELEQWEAAMGDSLAEGLEAPPAPLLDGPQFTAHF